MGGAAGLQPATIAACNPLDSLKRLGLLLRSDTAKVRVRNTAYRNTPTARNDLVPCLVNTVLFSTLSRSDPVVLHNGRFSVPRRRRSLYALRSAARTGSTPLTLPCTMVRFCCPNSPQSTPVHHGRPPSAVRVRLHVAWRWADGVWLASWGMHGLPGISLGCLSFVRFVCEVRSTQVGTLYTHTHTQHTRSIHLH